MRGGGGYDHLGRGRVEEGVVGLVGEQLAVTRDVTEGAVLVPSREVHFLFYKYRKRGRTLTKKDQR